MKSSAAKTLVLICAVLLVFPLPLPAAVDSVRISPLPFSAATGVTVETTISENSSVVSFEYRWFINDDEQFFEKSAHLPGHLLKRGDVVVVEVTPVTYAGERQTPIVSPPLETLNAPPVILSEPSEELTESGFRYQVHAVDPDGDELTFRLEGAPDNMTINMTSGLILWSFNVMPEGNFPVKIIVADGRGGESEQLFELQMFYEEVPL